MNVDIPQSWNPFLQDELNKSYFHDLMLFVNEEYEQQECFPPKENIFSAFKLTSFEDVKVVIIGQDPYHDFGQANGLCFSVNEGVKIPPSLRNIFKEIETDLKIPFPNSGNLERWAKQGVLLLNATLTVRAHQAGSHQRKGWEKFTNAVIKTISDKKENVIFLIWGGIAKKKIKFIDESRHLVLFTGHPSPLSANRGYWFGNNQFSKTNSLLEQVGKKVIEW